MEPVSFILGVASSVLSKIIADLVGGKFKAASKKEIEMEATLILLQEMGEENRNLKIFLLKVMKEIHTLSVRNPDLRATYDYIELRTPVRQLEAGSSDGTSQNPLLLKLHRMNTIIEERRKEIGSEGDPSDFSQSSSGKVAPSEQVTFSASKDYESRIVRALKDTDDRIRQRRIGGSDK
jgi:hypothetical protein